MAVASRAIVEGVDVVSDLFGGYISVSVDLLLDLFFLEAAEERLRHGVVPAVSAPTHTELHVIRLAEAPPCIASELRALIGVNQCAVGSSATHGHQYGVEHQLPMERCTG